AQKEVVVRLPRTDLYPFPDHPFQVRDDEEMKETIQSVKEYGVIVPAIVRPREEGGYEIVAGHRRKYACEQAGLDTMPVLIRNLDRDAATIIMEDSTFSIYQLKRGDETRDLRFEPYDRLQAAGLTIDRVNYELVYTAPLTKDMTLGDIWERFNIDHPADFKGHSLSVSDIVVLHQNDEDTAHYVDSIGFQQVPEFLQEQQTPVFDKLPPEQQQALSDTVQDTLQMLVDADKRIYG